jgi:hypothetical protein
MTEEWCTDELRGMWKEATVAETEIRLLSLHLLGGTEELHEKMQSR